MNNYKEINEVPSPEYSDNEKEYMGMVMGRLMSARNQADATYPELDDQNRST